jgi:type III secretion protein R
VQSSQRIWEKAPAEPAGPQDITILTPSFLVSELTRAFEIGFLIYLPFLMIDFAVSAILVALGMQMMSPTVVSTPLKLLLFVVIDGWRRLLEGLVLSYAV